MRAVLPLILGAVVWVFQAAAPSHAQLSIGEVGGLSLPQMSVVVLDRDALYANSLFGQRVRGDVEAALSELTSQNRRIEAELEAEEQRLTEMRATTETADFRALAIAFDEKVEGIRRAQSAKERAISQQTDRAQALFFEQARPVLSRLAIDSGALVILDRRSVIAAADQVDITTEAVARIDEVLGEGAGLEQPE